MVTKPASEIWRDYVIDGNAGSGVNQPDKDEIRTWGGEVEAALPASTPIPATEKGAANGVAPLDANGYVPDANINPKYRGDLNLQGDWDAATNTPTLADGVGNAGDLYRVSVAGTTTLDGMTDFTVGEEIYFDDVNSLWRRVGKDTVGAGGGGSSAVIAKKVTKLPNPQGRSAMYRLRYVIVNDSEIWATGYGGELATGTNPAQELGDFKRVRFHKAQSGSRVKLVTGGYCAAVLDDAGNVFTIGRNSEGQLGLGDNDDRGEFTRVEYFVDNTIVVSDIEGSDQDEQTEEMFAAISSTGQLYTWGYNGRGNLGIGNTTNQNEPQAVSGMTTVESVSVGGSGGIFCGAIKTDGTLWMCGYNGLGQLGLNDTTQRTSFTQVPLIFNAQKIVCVASYAGANLYGFALLLLDSGQIFGTGYNAYGQLGVGDLLDKDVFTQIGSDSDWSDIWGHNGTYGQSAAKKTNGDVYVWGDNTRGQIGDGTTTAAQSPYKPTGDFQTKCDRVVFTGMSNDGGIVILDTDGHMWGAGQCIYGQLGFGLSRATSTAFEKIVTPEGLTVKDVVAVGTTQIGGLSVILSDDTFCVCGYGSTGMLGFDGIYNGANHLYHLERHPTFQ